MTTTLLAYLGVGLFLLTEGRLRQSSEARSLASSESDRGSTRLIGAYFGVACLALLVAPLLNMVPVGCLGHPRLAGWAGIVIIVGGISLRFWANRALGAYYTRTLRTAQAQRIVREGPYRLIRHPGYLGVMSMWVGAGLATANWITGLIIVVGVLCVYAYRIRSEETMLAQAFGEQYAAYEAHTWRLVPFIF
jgi:protein-S-isoprenylcysteine O-methyltransferase Ste14